METEEERRARLEIDAATKLLRLAMEMDKERKARLEKMVATTELMLVLIKGVVNVGVVLSIKPILKSSVVLVCDRTSTISYSIFFKAILKF